jgi:hypothetical protein
MLTDQTTAHSVARHKGNMTVVVQDLGIHYLVDADYEAASDGEVYIEGDMEVLKIGIHVVDEALNIVLTEASELLERLKVATEAEIARKLAEAAATRLGANRGGNE